MTAYIRALKDAVDEEQERLVEQKTAEIRVALERLTPLEDRLARLLASIPPELQRDGLSLPTLQAALRGRWRNTCHPGELGSALRKLGFSRVRRWSSEASFGAVWRRS
jgi:hypothetical protein